MTNKEKKIYKVMVEVKVLGYILVEAQNEEQAIEIGDEAMEDFSIHLEDLDGNPIIMVDNEMIFGGQSYIGLEYEEGPDVKLLKLNTDGQLLDPYTYELISENQNINTDVTIYPLATNVILK